MTAASLADAHDLAAALDFAIEFSERVGPVYVRPMLCQESHVGEHIGLGIVHQCCKLADARLGLVGELPPLLACSLGIIPGEGVPIQTETIRRCAFPALHLAALPSGASTLELRLSASHARPR